MAGQRQPTNLVIEKGKKHFTKEEIEARKNSEVVAPSDNIIAPVYLTKKQIKEFNDISRRLIDIEIMSNLDCDALARFIIAKDNYIKFTKMLNEIPDDFELIGAIDKVVSIQDKAFKQCRSAASDLGLTISSRCKLVVPKKPDEKPKSGMSKFMQNRNNVVNINHAVGDE